MTIYAHNNLFIDNKYRVWYYQIIDKARTKTYDGYSEVHHIIPTCLGGSDDPDNLIRLSYPEHFLCHWLLIKFVRTSEDRMKMSYALHCMTTFNERQKRIVASWQFEVAKRAAKDNMSGENHFNHGKKHYNNGIKIITLSADEEVPEGFVLGGLPRSEEHSRKLGDITRGKKFYNNGTKNIMISDDEEIPEGFVPGMLPRTDETRRKIGANSRGRKRYNNGIKEIFISNDEEIPEEFVLGRLPTSDETRRKLRDKKFYNNGIKSITLSDGEEIPEGFVLGISEEQRRKQSDNTRGKKWYNNGTKSIRLSDDQEIPEGFVLGGLPRKRPS
jgi:hypothetical protein